MILVTGGTGFVGSHLLYQLTLTNPVVRALYRTEATQKKVLKVFSYYHDRPEELFNKIQWVQADITDIASLTDVFEGVTKVYHTAAVVSFDPASYRLMRQVNIKGTANIVNCCIDHHVKKLCFFSSIATLGTPLENRCVTEEDEWNSEVKNHGYAITKYGAEMEVWRGSQEGLDVVILHPGVILGPGFWNTNTGTLFTKVNNGLPFYTEGSTGFVGVQDVAVTAVNLMESSIRNQGYIVVAENASFKEVLDEIANGFGKRPPYIKVTKWVTSVLWRVDTLFSKLLNKPVTFSKATTASMHSKTCYSSQKLVDQTAIELATIQKVIQQTCEVFDV